MRDVQAAGAVALFAADVPLGDLVGVDVVVDGVAAVAERAGGALHVGVGVEGRPPVGALLDVIGEPAFFCDVPLRGEDEVVVADFGEVALLVAAAVDEGDLVEREGDERVGVVKSPRTASGCSLGERRTLAMRVCFQPSYCLVWQERQEAEPM